MDDALGSEHHEFLQWAVSEGIVVQGVAPAKFPGRGLGMVATRTIQENEHVVTVPVSAMLTIDSIPAEFVKKFPEDASTHCVLAAYLTHGDNDDGYDDSKAKLDLWRMVWPSWQDFKDTVPMLWPEYLEPSSSMSREHSTAKGPTLPPSASGVWHSISPTSQDIEYGAIYQNILSQQQDRFRAAWEEVISVFPNTEWEPFAYNWFIINTRSFYYVTPGKGPPEDWNDAVGMVPVADYFNHTGEPPCQAAFNNTQYIVRANRRIEKGEEVYISYGSHSNDFLLVEYGFFIDENPYDAIYLDDIVFRDLTAADSRELEKLHYYGNYEITSSGACYRTEIAACMKYMVRKDWRNYVAGRSTKGLNPKKTAEVIRGWIDVYLNETQVGIEGIQKAINESGDPAYASRISAVLRRWTQIKSLCEDALSATSSNGD